MQFWNDYWQRFEALTESLERSGERQIIVELKEAQKWVNGLTDGWHDFKVEMEKVLHSNRSRMTIHQIDALKELVTTLNHVLSNR